MNGVATPGPLPQLTGADGCLTAEVTTSGVVPPADGDDEPRVVFSAIGQEAEVLIVTEGLILTANPNTVIGDGPEEIVLNLIDVNGNPVNGVLLLVTCTTSGGGVLDVVVPPGRTGEPQTIAECNNILGQNCPGQTTARIDASGFECSGTPPTGTCTFATTTGEPSATVTWVGVNGEDFSPPAPNCAGGGG